MVFSIIYLGKCRKGELFGYKTVKINKTESQTFRFPSPNLPEYLLAIIIFCMEWKHFFLKSYKVIE